MNVEDVKTPVFDLIESKLDAERKAKETLKSAKSNFPSLDSSMLQKVKATLKTSNQLIISKHNRQIMSEDIHRLRNGQWLNDELINFYGFMIDARSKHSPDLPKIHFFNSFFYQSLKTNGYAKVRRWTKKFDLFELDLVIFPVHLGAHWCCGCVDFRRKTFEYYDSMHGLDRQFFSVIRTYIHHLYASFEFSV